MDLFNKKHIKELENRLRLAELEADSYKIKYDVLKGIIDEERKEHSKELAELDGELGTIDSLKTVMERLMWETLYFPVKTRQGYIIKEVKMDKDIRISIQTDDWQPHPVIEIDVDGKWIPSYMFYESERGAINSVLLSNQPIKFSPAVREAIMEFKQILPF